MDFMLACGIFGKVSSSKQGRAWFRDIAKQSNTVELSMEKAYPSRIIKKKKVQFSAFKIRLARPAKQPGCLGDLRLVRQVW
jgi:hypothetical protein